MQQLKEYQFNSEEILLEKQIEEVLKKSQAQGKRLADQLTVLEQRYNEDK
jgi:hypothetical protein